MRSSYERTGRSNTATAIDRTGKGHSKPAVPALQQRTISKGSTTENEQQGAFDARTLQMQTQPVVQREITGEEYVQVKEVAKQIMMQYPPDKYHYIGLGKSPTPVIAFMQSYGSVVNNLVSAHNMPLSKFGHRTSGMSRAERNVVGGTELDAEQKERLSDHFDNFILDHDDIAQGKSILLIDFVQTGKSLIATQRNLQEYLENRYLGKGITKMMFSILSALRCFPSMPKVEALPLAIEEQQVGGTKTTMDSLGLSDKAIMLPGSLDDEGSLAARMGGEMYKGRAEYPDDFKISAEDRPETKDIRHDPRKEYARMRAEFNEFMLHDASLVRLLEGPEAIDDLNERESEIQLLIED